jgi:hypothetical protein
VSFGPAREDLSGTGYDHGRRGPRGLINDILGGEVLAQGTPDEGRAVAQWAKDNTADLRRLAGQITALTDLDAAAGTALARLHRALGDPDASALPALLAATHHHLPRHRDLAVQVDTVTAPTDQIRRQAPSA